MAVMLGLNETFWKQSNPLVASARVIEIILPLFAAMQAAFLLSPEDEPSLELLLSTPRPFNLVLLERLALLLGLYAGIGVVFSLVGLVFVDQSLGRAIWRWFSPTIWLVSVAVLISLVTRQGMLGALAALMLWASFLLGGDGFAAQCRQLFPLHMNFQPTGADVTPLAYAVNRGALVLSGFAFLSVSSNIANDAERLLGARSPVRFFTRLASEIKNYRSYLWLVLGTGMLFLAQGEESYHLAQWLAPVFLLQAALSHRGGTAPSAIFLSAAVVSLVHETDITQAGDGCRVAHSLTRALFFVIPFVAFGVILARSPRFTLDKTLILPISWLVSGSSYHLLQVSLDQMTVPGMPANIGPALIDWEGAASILGVTFLMAWSASFLNWIWSQRSILSSTTDKQKR